MASRWTTLKVELLGGRGQPLEPPPGRVLMLPPRLTFEGLGEAIDLALGRWDLAHLRMFELADGTVVTDEETAAEAMSGPAGPIAETLPLTSTIARRIHKGEEFSYIFDLGDDWTHRCTVMGKVDPFDEVGFLPTEPMAIWGWGSLPDQHGRVEDDYGEPRSEPSKITYPMLRSETTKQPAVDLDEFRGAIARQEPDAAMAAMRGAEIDHALQQLGSGLLAVWPHASGRTLESLRDIAVAVCNRLTWRQWPGDRELAADLLSHARDEATVGVDVSLESLEEALWSDVGDDDAAYLSLTTGEVVHAMLTDEAMVGDDAVDVDTPDWRRVDRFMVDGRDWDDLAAYVATVDDAALQARLEEAIEGKGAFSRFRRALPDERAHEWHAFRTDRRWGRLRVALADVGAQDNVELRGR